jgi:hypothetical protein
MATDPMNGGGAATVDTPAPETVPVGLWKFFACFLRLGIGIIGSVLNGVP